MKTDRLSGLLALKAVAEKRNFSAAAGGLGVSPSAVSQAIRQLEKRLGVALVSRTTRSTRLTEAGERFLSQAGPALDQILHAMDGLGSYAAGPSGLLRINLPRAVYPSLIAPLVSSYCRKYPQVTVQLFFDESLSDVVASGFDAGIRLSEMMAQDMVALRIGRPLRWVVLGSPKYLKQRGRPKRPEDLLAHDCIRMGEAEEEVYDRWEFEDQGKDFRVRVNGSLILNDSNLAVEAAIHGSGLIYFAAELVQDQVKSGELEVVLERYAAHSDGFYLYYPKRSQMMPKLRAFVDHMRDESRRNRLGGGR